MPPDTMRRNLVELCWLRNILILMMAVTATYCHVSGINLLAAGPGLAWVFVLMMLINLLTALRLRSASEVDGDELFLQILLDLVLLTALFHLSGASSNPFVTYYLVPLAIAASTLPLRQTAALATLTLLAYSTLFYFSPMPMAVIMSINWPWQSYHGHLLGMWVNFILSSCLLVVFLGRMQRRLRDQQRFMAEQQRRQLQRDQAVAMGALAANAVHELATPLSTLMLLADELESVLPTGDSEQRAIASLQTQLQRCRDILAHLRTQARSPESVPEKPLHEHIDNCLQPLQSQYAECQFDLQIFSGGERVVALPWLLQQVLHNGLKNAAEAARSRVVLSVDFADGLLRCTIRDDGPGFPDDILALSHEPVPSTKPDGLGLGLFLAKVTLNEMGGHIVLRNPAEGGAEMQLDVPL